MVNSITCIFSFDFTDPIPNRFKRFLIIHLGDIISPRCFLTVSDISVSLSPSNAIGIQVTSGGSCLNLSKAMLRSLIAFLQMSENHGLLKHFGTAEVLGIVSSAMSFKMEVNKYMGSSAMAGWCRRVLQRCWN